MNGHSACEHLEAASRPRGAGTAKAQQSRDALLQVTTAMIARYGFDASSVREITSQAGVRLARVTEAFGGVEKLTRAVVERGSVPLAKARTEALEKLGGHGAPTFAAIAAAYIRPLIALMRQSAEWQDYARVWAQLAVSAKWDGKLGSLIELEAGGFLEAIAAADRRLTLADAAWCYTFMIGSMATVVSRMSWMRMLSGGELGDLSLDEGERVLLDYVPGGMAAVADHRDTTDFPPSHVARTRSTKMPDRILDHAEKLFAKSGFHGVSVRQIAASAEASVGICDYHFGSKPALFLAMCKRRQPRINAERLLLLDSLQGLPEGRQRLASAVGAAMWPIVQQMSRGGQAWRDHYRAMANSLLAQDGYWMETLDAVFARTGRAMVGGIRDSVPGLPLELAFAAYQLMYGQMAVGYSGEARVSRLSGGAATGKDYLAMYRRFVEFNVGGILALAGPG